VTPENLAKNGESERIPLEKLRNSNELPRSADPQADRHKVLCAQNTRPYRPLGLVDLDFHLLGLGEGLRIKVAGDRKEPDGPNFNNEPPFPVLFITLRFQVS